MKMNEIERAISPLELILKWNQYCDRNNREGDCILLSEPRTYQEADVLNDVINKEDLRRNEGFLVPVWCDDGRYRGMRWVAEDYIGKWVELDCIDKV